MIPRDLSREISMDDLGSATRTSVTVFPGVFANCSQLGNRYIANVVDEQCPHDLFATSEVLEFPKPRSQQALRGIHTVCNGLLAIVQHQDYISDLSRPQILTRNLLRHSRLLI